MPLSVLSIKSLARSAYLKWPEMAEAPRALRAAVFCVNSVRTARSIAMDAMHCNDRCNPLPNTTKINLQICFKCLSHTVNSGPNHFQALFDTKPFLQSSPVMPWASSLGTPQASAGRGVLTTLPRKRQGPRAPGPAWLGSSRVSSNSTTPTEAPDTTARRAPGPSGYAPRWPAASGAPPGRP